MPLVSPTAFVRRFIEAMDSSDMATVQASFDPQVRAFVTNAEGGTDLVEGSEALGQRFPDFAAMADSFSATVTQVHDIDDQTALFMVEIRAERLGRSLHNFAAGLIRLSEEGKMTEYRMVEALPLESDRFWSA
jgi:SnoaL-like protein